MVDASLPPERVGRSPATKEMYARTVEGLLADSHGRPLAALTVAEIDLHLAGWRAAFLEQHRRLPQSGDVPQQSHCSPVILRVDGALRSLARTRRESACQPDEVDRGPSRDPANKRLASAFRRSSAALGLHSRA